MFAHVWLWVRNHLLTVLWQHTQIIYAVTFLIEVSLKMFKNTITK